MHRLRIALFGPRFALRSGQILPIQHEQQHDPANRKAAVKT
jgi:hypothetical protein